MARRLRTLFFRDFNRFSGGHLKVWDYFNHVRSSPRHVPRIYFSPRTVWDANNPWIRARRFAVDHWTLEQADILFLGGTDWKMLNAAERRKPPIPIINLIQHVRHGSKSDSRYKFLKYPAVRICVSEQVADAVRDTQTARGPVLVIPNGIDLDGMPKPVAPVQRPIELIVAGLKHPVLAQRIARTLADRVAGRIEVLTNPLPRKEFLSKLAQARTSLLLPHEREGFYLPALEAMALGTIVVCPDCVGNRDFCVPNENCLRPEYRFDAIASATLAATRLPPQARQRMVVQAGRTARSHSLGREQVAFHNILDNLHRLW